MQDIAPKVERRGRGTQDVPIDPLERYSCSSMVVLGTYSGYMYLVNTKPHYHVTRKTLNRGSIKSHLFLGWKQFSNRALPGDGATISRTLMRKPPDWFSGQGDPRPAGDNLAHDLLMISCSKLSEKPNSLLRATTPRISMHVERGKNE